MSYSNTRVSTANMYENALRNMGARQTSLANLQENLTSGKRVLRASDDPVAAAQAERAMTRISRIQTEQRALDVQRNAVAQAESSLGDAIGLMQEMRELVVSAGSGVFSASDRTTVANQLEGLRTQLRDVANRKDTNGVPLLSALGSAAAPFLSAMGEFDGLAGQMAGSAVSIPNALDGESAFMFRPQRDGAFNAAISNASAAYPLSGRQFTTSAVQVSNPAGIQQNPVPPGAPYSYSLVFTSMTQQPDGSFDATYDITSSNPAFTPVSATASGLATNKTSEIPVTIVDPGGATLSFKISAKTTVDATGAAVVSPAPGDTVSISASASLFGTLDSAIQELGSAGNNNAATQAVGQALANMDIGLARLQNVRSYAGELLNRADRISGNQEARSVQLEADRSRAEDLDMIKGISDLQNQQVGNDAALKSYAMVQKLSLFNYIS